jgi:hypothetical protein
MWSGAVSSYINPGMDALDYKTVEEFQSFGDPTLSISSDSQAPNKPTKPSGPATGKINTKYTYSTSAIDPEGDQVYYLFDWGDNTTSGWVGPFNSGATGSADHKWTEKYTYEVKSIAKDENGVIGDWSDPLTVTMPRDKSIDNNYFILKILENHPYIFQILINILSI